MRHISVELQSSLLSRGSGIVMPWYIFLHIHILCNVTNQYVPSLDYNLQETPVPVSQSRTKRCDIYPSQLIACLTLLSFARWLSRTPTEGLVEL